MHGGLARRDQLRSMVHWRAIEAALAEGSIIRTSHGRYALPIADKAKVRALRLSAVASHISAAAHWGWKVKLDAQHPHVTVRQKRSLAGNAADGAIVHWRDLEADDVVDGWVTTKVRTVIDCCLDLPFDEALSVADSARRSGLSIADVRERSDWLGIRQRARVERVLAVSHQGAANPFESVLRAIALRVKGLHVDVQYRVRYEDFYARVDLADPDLMLILEADSFEFHGKRHLMEQDCRRYDELVARGWLVLRFSWEQVMFQADWVECVIARTVALRRQGQPTGRRPRDRATSA